MKYKYLLFDLKIGITKSVQYALNKIGDRKHDIIGANNNGIDSISAGYGYGSEEELRGAGCTFYITEPREILKVVSQKPGSGGILWAKSITTAARSDRCPIPTTAM
ncbi:MAG: hypothetical protein C6W55_17095 [Thermobacillus sp.]|nr:MAG: hypothetical protein C6W55_17095 [Thermobacillus sp.]